MAIRLNKEGVFEFDSVEEAIKFEEKRGGSSTPEPKKTEKSFFQVTPVIEEEYVERKPKIGRPRKTKRSGYTAEDIEYINTFCKNNSSSKGYLRFGTAKKLAKALGRTEKAIGKKICELKKEGVLDRAKQKIDKPVKTESSYSDNVKDFVEEFYKKHMIGAKLPSEKFQELVATLGMSTNQANDLVMQLRDEGKINGGYRTRPAVSFEGMGSFGASQPKPKPVKKKNQRKKRKRQMHNKRWTPADVQMLKELREKNTLKNGSLRRGALLKIAKQLKRTRQAIMFRMHAEGMTR